MYIEITTQSESGDGYLSTFTEDGTSQICKPTSDREAIELVEWYQQQPNFTVEEKNPNCFIVREIIRA